MTSRFRRAGLILLGKTSVPELSLTAAGESAVFGVTANPWDEKRTPGGSSGGSAAAVASRFVPIASAEDGGGSIRIPASCCGVFGMKPTRGRTPAGPDDGDVWRGFCQAGVVTRSVRDSAAILDAVAGPDPGAPDIAPPPLGPFQNEVGRDPGRLRIAFCPVSLLGDSFHEECARGLSDTVAHLEELGHEVVEARPPVDGERFAFAFLTMVACETRASVEWVAGLAGKRLSLSDFEPVTIGLALLGQATTGGEYAAALNYLAESARGLGRFFEEFDILVTPMLPEPPPLTGFLQPSLFESLFVKAAGRLRADWLLRVSQVAKPLAAKTFEFVSWAPVFNASGQPAMSVPLHWTDDGLPIGMQFAGRFGEEASLFRLAGQLERSRPWIDRVPAFVSGGRTELA